MSVTLEEITHGVRLTIADNGRGLGDHADGHGLAGMRQRIEATGGTLTVSDENGVRLVAELHESEQTPEGAVIFEPIGSEAGP
jgi:signal transduction histidine kinase